MASRADWDIAPCTCGRGPRDYSDLAVIAEEDGKAYKRSTAKSSTKSKVVCLRSGCRGAWKTSNKYIKKLPRMLNIVYLRQKEKEEKEAKENGIQVFSSHEMNGQTC